MKLNILLIRPNICIRKGFGFHNKIHPPIGLAYLAAPLLENGHNVRILDMVCEKLDSESPYHDTHICYGMTDQDLQQYIADMRPDLVGITGFTAQHSRMVDIARIVKQRLPATIVVFGGCHASASPEILLEQTQGDYVVLGEGERTFARMADALASGKRDMVRELDGVAYRDGSRIVKSAKRHFEPRLDDLLLPARQLLANDVYIANHVSMPVITSRGCPMSCSFCSIHHTQGNKWRTRSTKNVVDEIEYIVSDLGYKGITIFDDAPNLRAEHLIDICREIVRRGLKFHLTLPGGVIVKTLTRDALYWLKEAGCLSVALPFEHVDDTIRNEVMHKGLSTDIFDTVLAWCRELEILTLVKFVIGMPGETEQSLELTNRYVKENAHRFDIIQVVIATPFPGTELYEQCISEGYVVNPGKNGFLEYDFYEAIIETPELSRKRVDTYKQLIETSFNETRGDVELLNLVRRATRKPDDELVMQVRERYFAPLRASRQTAEP